MSLAGPKSPVCGKLPYAGNEHEVIFSESYTDRNVLMMVWCLERSDNDRARFDKKSADLIMALLDNEGEGSLFQCLKALNYAQDID